MTTIPLMTAVAISNILYTSLHSFFPIYIETHFPSLSTIHFSIIIAIFEVSNLLTSLILGLFMSTVRRKNLIVWSNFLLMISTLSFMMLPSLTEGNPDSRTSALVFFILCLLFRVMQGIAGASIQIAGYSYATNEMSDEKDLYIGYVEMALGIGDMIGPAMAGLFYELSGFAGTFAIFGGMIFVGMILSIVWIPSSLNDLSSTNKQYSSKPE
jgi:MFS family permease